MTSNALWMLHVDRAHRGHSIGAAMFGFLLEHLRRTRPDLDVLHLENPLPREREIHLQFGATSEDASSDDLVLRLRG